MSATESRIDWHAAQTLDRLMSDRGWNPRDVEIASRRTGDPRRVASYRTIYRILKTGHKPTRPVRREIAEAFGLKPSQIWTSDQWGNLAPPLPVPEPRPVAA